LEVTEEQDVSIGETIAESAEAMRKILRAARTHPRLIKLPEQPVKVVINAALVGAVLVFANRCLIYPQTIGNISEVGLSLLVAASSLIFVFLISAAFLLFRTDNEADQEADRWSVLFSFVWMVTLLICLIDYLFHAPFGGVVAYLGAGEVLGLDRGILIQFAVYAVLSYVILLIRTRLLENGGLSWGQGLLGFFVVVPICTGMLYAFVRLAAS